MQYDAGLSRRRIALGVCSDTVGIVRIENYMIISLNSLWRPHTVVIDLFAGTSLDKCKLALSPYAR